MNAEKIQRIKLSGSLKRDTSLNVLYGSANILARNMSKIVNRKLFRCETKDSLSKLFSDMYFVVGPERERIFTHKCILSARNEIFKQLFASEPSRSVFELDRVKPVPFLLLVYFLYTNSISFDRLESDGLAEAQLSEMVDMKNVCQYLPLAIKMKRSRLVHASLEFIEENSLMVLTPFNAELFDLTPEAMKLILLSDLLDVDESRLVEVACYWAEHHLNQARQQLINLERLNSKTSIVTIKSQFAGMEAGKLSADVSSCDDSLSAPPIVHLSDAYEKLTAKGVEKQAIAEINDVMGALRLALLPMHELARLEEEQSTRLLIAKEYFVDAWRLIALQSNQAGEIDPTINRTIGTARRGTASRSSHRRKSAVDLSLLHRRSKFKSPDPLQTQVL